MKLVRAWRVVAAALVGIAAVGRCLSLHHTRRNTENLDPHPQSVARRERSTVAAASATAAGWSAIHEPGRESEGNLKPQVRTTVVRHRDGLDAIGRSIKRLKGKEAGRLTRRDKVVERAPEWDDGGRAEERKKRVMRRTPAEEKPPPPPLPLFHDNEYEDDDGLLSGEPTMKEMAQVLTKEGYDKYVEDWKRGKASRRMDRAISRGYMLSAEEEAQQELDHQSAVEVQKVERKVMRILVRSKRARPAMVETFQERASADVDRRRAWRKERQSEFQTLKALVQQKQATAAQVERYQTIKEARKTANRLARAREREAIAEAKAGMAKLKPLIETRRATKAQLRRYAQLEAFVENKRANGAAQDKRYREKKAKRKEEEKGREKEKEARDAPSQGAQSNASGPDKKDNPLQMASHPLLNQFESSLRKGFRSLREMKLQTLTWLQRMRHLAPESAPPALGELVLPE
ncbi:MAG: hypothetical protein M1826_000182 [Phylliscum demangeonii]|nr:MAG: hypothetical protein M1826_000182 [Phylliscum demangeonii]